MRVKEVTVEDIRKIPINIKSRKLNIMDTLKEKTIRKDAKENSTKCPYKTKQTIKNQIETNEHNIPIVEASPVYTNTRQPNNLRRESPIYRYPSPPVRLPYMPLTTYPIPSLFHIFDEKRKKQSIDQLLV